jgi:hypothetical protein
MDLNSAAIKTGDPSVPRVHEGVGSELSLSQRWLGGFRSTRGVSLEDWLDASGRARRIENY